MKKSILAIIALVLLPINLQAQRKYAFLVGISQYDNATTNYEWSNIHGVEDVRLISPLLAKQGFSLTTILDEEATYMNIKYSLNRFIRKCRRGDIVYIHFSMHGQPFEDKNGDEIDKWDESLVPIDAYKYFSEGIYEGQCHITDDELNAHISRLRKTVGERGCVYVIVDACHAGTSSRGEELTRGTMIGFTSDTKNQYNPPMESKINFIIPNIEGSSSVTFIEACRSDQINRELKTESGIYGALSYNVAQALKQVRLSRDKDQFIDAIKQSTKLAGHWPHNQNMVVETCK